MQQVTNQKGNRDAKQNYQCNFSPEHFCSISVVVLNMAGAFYITHFFAVVHN